MARFANLLALAIALRAAVPAAGLELVRDGKPLVGIILPAQPLPVETYAADELQYHIEAATGARLAIISEKDGQSAGGHVYLGHCEATARAGLLSDEILTPEAIGKAGSLLERAREQTAKDTTARARVDWLAKGLKQADLMLIVQRGYERAVDTGYRAALEPVHQALKEFRASNADYDKTNFAGLTGNEVRWEKLSEKSPP